MKNEEESNDEEVLICVKCIEDQFLRDLVESAGTVNRCTFCNGNNIVVSISELAEIIDPFIREHFRHGDYERRYGPGDDDSYDEEQQGEDLSYIVSEVLGQDLAFHDQLVDALIANDPYDPRDGGQPFYDETISYEDVEIHTYSLHSKWNEISQEIKTRQRFFSDSAKQFFHWLFEELEELRTFDDESENKVAYDWPANTAVYRARSADGRDAYTKIILSPRTELCPPSLALSRLGRMNPEGVSVFYGALDEATCLAEMRSSIGEHIVVGRFKTTKPLRILDFSRLNKAYWSGKGLSYFQSDFDTQIEKRKFLRELHRLISQPVIPGHESEYLITQVLAEYLAYVREPGFDGLLYESTQRENGIHVVLFPKGDAEEVNMLDRFSLKYSKGSAALYRTRIIQYDMRNIKFSIDRKDVSVIASDEE